MFKMMQKLVILLCPLFFRPMRTGVCPTWKGHHTHSHRAVSHQMVHVKTDTPATEAKVSVALWCKSRRENASSTRPTMACFPPL